MIAIIMAVYNGETYLREQLDSLLHNTCTDFVLHVFDDGSTDASPEILTEYAGKHPEQIFYHRNKENHGVIRNFLEGCACVDADYYMFCDQDDVWLPEKIAHTLQKMQDAEQSAPNTPIVAFGDATVVDEHLNTLHPSFQRQSGYRTDALDLAHIMMENKLIGCTVLFNATLKNLISEISPAIRMHDWWIALIAASMGQIVYLDEPLLLYRQHTGNVVGGSSRSHYIKSRLAHLAKQREVLYQTCAQAGAFLQLYGNKISPGNQRLLHLFATIPEANWFVRRYRIIRYHFYKSGLIRNLGVLLVI